MIHKHTLSMQAALKLNQELHLQGKLYTVIGIDTYTLKNLLGKTKKWTSYTLIDAKKNKTWISYGATGEYFTEWAIIPLKNFKQSAGAIKMDLTGVAHISFKGNPGYSTPLSEIVWLESSNKQYDYISLERFWDQKKNNVIPLEPYYQSGKIIKDFKI